MNVEEFTEAILNADEETVKTICQLLEVNPQLFGFPDLLFGNAHKASWHIP